MSVKKSNEKVFCSPELGELISDVICRYKMSAFLRDNITTERAEGRVEGIYAVAQNMKTLGLPMDTIIQATGLSAEEIAGL